MGAVTSYLKGDLGGVFTSITGVGKKIMSSNSGAADRAKQMNTSPAGRFYLIWRVLCFNDADQCHTCYVKMSFRGVVARIYKLQLMLQKLVKRLELWWAPIESRPLSFAHQLIIPLLPPQSWAFITALTKYPQQVSTQQLRESKLDNCLSIWYMSTCLRFQSYTQLLNTIRDELAAKYSQKPQLSASHPMDMSALFIM